MNTQESVTACLTDIAGLEAALVAKKTELDGYRTELRALLGQVNATNPKGSGHGRPRGPQDGPSVSQGVLEFLRTNASDTQGPGVSRADIIKAFPERETAVHAALRVHQQKGLIFNTSDHRWFSCDVSEPEALETPPVAV